MNLLTAHLTDKQMMEQVYGESDDPVAVERHLAACKACGASYADLECDLTGIAPLTAPFRDESYGERVWASIAPSLHAYPSSSRWNIASQFGEWLRSGWVLKGLGYAAAGVLLAAGAFYAGRQWEQRNRQPAPVAKVLPAPSAPQRQPIVVVVLDEHLDRSERFLVQLKHADLDSTDMASPIRDEAKSLLAANRVCRKNLSQSDDPELTSALDHLDRLLAEAANSPGGLNANSIAKLQDEMNTNGLLFQVRVLRSRILHRKAAHNRAEKGESV